MKANQAYKADEEAVSPVVGVILMVAITVVLAAVVFVLVNNLGKGSEKAPDMGFQVDNTARTIKVVKAPVGNDAIDYGTGLSFGGTCGATPVTDLNGAAYVGDGTEQVNAGDVIQVDTAATFPCEVTLTHLGTGTLVYTASFS